jgi:hypothetical protein
MPFKSELLSNDRFKNLLFVFMLLFAQGPKYLCGHKEGHAGPFLKRKQKHMLVTQLYRGSQFYWWGNLGTQRKPPTCRKSLIEIQAHNISGDRH